MTVAALFPGQGSQSVGMGEELFSLRPDLLGERADEILGWSLAEMCLEGPEETLTRTEHAQPALFALSYTLWEESEKRGLAVSAGAGHSLGEYTALCAAGAISFDDALKVVAARGQAMARAADLEPSGMAALIGADPELAETVVAANRAQGGRLEVANINAPGQVVVAGAQTDIDWLTDNVRDHGVRRAIPLKVAGAFHSAFMRPAADQISSVLASVSFSEPSFDVWSNTTARPHDFESLASTLTDQVVSPVRFEESLRSLADAGVDNFVHVGPGDVTAGMAKRTVEGAQVHVISSVDDIPSVVDSIVTMP